MICAMSFVFGGVKTGSRFYFLRRLDLIGFLDVDCLFKSYGAMNFFGRCVDFTLIALISQAAIIVLCVSFLILKSGERVGDSVKNSEKSLSRPVYSIAANECFKLFVCHKGALLITGIVVLKLALSLLYYSSGNSSYEKLYRSYLTEVDGPVTAEN